MGITISSISQDISVPNQITLYFTVTATDPSILAGILFALDPSSIGTADLISVGQPYTTVSSIYSPTNGITVTDAGATFIRWDWPPTGSSLSLSIVLSDPTYYDNPTNLSIYAELTGTPSIYGLLAITTIAPATTTTISPTTTPAPTTTVSAYDPFSNSVSQISLSGIPLAGNCGTANQIASDTLTLLLGCTVCPAAINASQYTAGSLLHGAVSSKMKCNARGAFCYDQKIGNRCDDAVDQRFKHFDIATYSEFDTQSLLTIYRQSNAVDPGIMSPQIMGPQIMGPQIMGPQIMGLAIDHPELKLILLTKLRLRHKLQMQINGNALNGKQAMSRINHRVNIAWDFRSIPRITPCSNRNATK